MVLALLLHNAVALRHGLAMAGGLEVCSASGPVRLDAQGHPLPDGGASHHDCCLGVPLAPPSSAPTIALAPADGALPIERPASPRRAATWLAPLSRGPPTQA